MTLVETTKLMDARRFRQLKVAAYLPTYVNYYSIMEKSKESKLHLQGSGRFVAAHVLKCCPRSFFQWRSQVL